jgi:Family of unknown function (DUF6232)
MSNEVTFLENGGITVTSARFVVGTKTFAVRGITSVQLIKVPAYYGGAVILILAGLVPIVIGIRSSIAFTAVGFFILFGGVWSCFRQKPSYAVVLRTADGEVTAYQSKDRSHVVQIVEAINDSIISNG